MEENTVHHSAFCQNGTLYTDVCMSNVYPCNNQQAKQITKSKPNYSNRITDMWLFCALVCPYTPKEFQLHLMTR